MEFCNIGGKLLEFDTPKIMGILNLTPDSFFDGGVYHTKEKACAHVDKLLADGADLIDIGAYSSRPGAMELSAQEELDRLIPVVDELVIRYPHVLLSIDTFRSEVAKEAILHGAHLINDISGGNLDDAMFATVAELGVPYILMHSRGNPQTMQAQTAYNHLIEDIIADFTTKIGQLRALGVKDIIIDPGFGFAKTLTQNYELLNHMEALHILGVPILGALSRKSMIYKLLDIEPLEALNGTSVLNTILLTKGVQLIRVHDVKEAVEVRTLVGQLRESNLYS